MLTERTVNLIFLILSAIALIIVTRVFEQQTFSEDAYQGSFTLYAKFMRDMQAMIRQDTATRRQYYQQMLAFYVLPPLALILPTGFKLLFGRNTVKMLGTSFFFIILILAGYWIIAALATQIIRKNGLWLPKFMLASINQTLAERLLQHYAEQLHQLQQQIEAVTEQPDSAARVTELKAQRTAMMTRAQQLKRADQSENSHLKSELQFSDEEINYLDSVSKDGDAVNSGLTMYAFKYDMTGAFELLARQFTAMTSEEQHQDYQHYLHTQKTVYWLVVGLVAIQVLVQLFG